MKKNHFFAAIIVLLALGSCKKQDSTPADPNPIIPPAGFLWESSTNTSLTVSINDPRFGDALHTISVYDTDPQNGGSLLAKGAVATGQPFAAQLYLADTLHSLVVVKTAPDGSVMQQLCAIDATHKITATLGLVPVPTGRPTGGPDCTSGCGRTITQTDNNINIANGETVCVTGSNITVSFTANNNGTIRLCGTNITVQNASLNNGSSLVVAASGSVAFSNLNINSGIVFQNYGTCSFSGSLSPNGPLTNAGTITINGDLAVNADGTLINQGTLTVSGNTTINSNKKNSNKGTITTKNFTLNQGSVFTNLCTLGIAGDFSQNSGINNYQLITVAGTTTVNAGASIELDNSAMLITAHLMLNGELRGEGTTSLFKVTNRTNINADARIRDALQFCDDNGIETNYAGSKAFTNGAVQKCDVYIPTGDCNKTGNGKAAVVDADGDGVADALDDYPTIAAKAFNNYYPAANSRALVAFEDLWPSKGDYDFNDLVADYQHNIVTNAANKIAAINSSFTLLASGGKLHNGFGIEFPLAATAVSNVKGAVLEAKQSKAVLILFTNMRQQMATGNTLASEASSAPVLFTTSFDVTSGPLLSSIGLGVYNPFTWNYDIVTTTGRNEIHLPAHSPTTLGSTALFATKDDASNITSGKYYLTKTGMPWAITLPTGFKWPLEGATITHAYKHFAAWANSGGTNYPNWYQPLADNMVNSYIYKP